MKPDRWGSILLVITNCYPVIPPGSGILNTSPCLTWSFNWSKGQVEICPQLPELVCATHTTVLVPAVDSQVLSLKWDKISCQGFGWLVQGTLMGHLVKQGGSRCCSVSTHAALDRLVCFTARLLGKVVCECAGNTLDLMNNNWKRDKGYFCFIYLLMHSQSGSVARSTNGAFWMWVQGMLWGFHSRAKMSLVWEKF